MSYDRSVPPGGPQEVLSLDAPCDHARIQEQLARVLRSEVFRRSEQQRNLLAHLTQRSLEGQSDELKEYSVGVDALGKRQDYDPRKDATVRIQIGKLRARLEEYYRTEGAADPIVFNLPKGGFRVLFHNRPEGPVEAIAPPAPKGSGLRWLCAALLLLLIIAGVLLIRQALALSRTRASAELAARLWTPELESIWAPFLEDGRPLTLSLGTPLFISFDGIPVRDSFENNWQQGALPANLERIRAALQATDVRPNYGYNGFGETVGALRLYRLFLARGKDVTFRRSSSLSWDDFRERDLILLGSPKSVLHLRHFRNLRTRLAFDVQEDRIINYNPREGEAPFYRKPEGTTEGAFEGYALVTRLPGVDGAGNIMILGSPDTEGTRAACEYVADPATARELLRQFGRVPLPPAYQVLLKITSRTEVPLVVTAIAHRELKAD